MEKLLIIGFIVFAYSLVKTFMDRDISHILWGFLGLGLSFFLGILMT